MSKEEAKLKVYQHTIALVIKMTSTLLTMIEIFESLALKEAKDEKEHLVIDDDITNSKLAGPFDLIAMTGMKIRVRTLKGERTMPLTKDRWHHMKELISRARGIAQSIEPKMEEE